MGILVVDDNLANREVARHVLEMEGYRVDTARSGAEALVKAGDSSFSLVLMDIQMPDMCGCETTLRLRTLERPGRRVPVFALTAYASALDRRRYADHGLEAVLQKPLDTQQLRRALQSHRPLPTVDFGTFLSTLNRLGPQTALQHYTFFLRKTRELTLTTDHAGFESCRVTAKRLGLSVIEKRLNEAAHVDRAWRGIVLESLQLEADSAWRFLKSGLSAVPFRDTDGRTSSNRRPPSRPV